MENLYTTSRVYISRIIRARAFKRTRFGDRVSDVDKKNEKKNGARERISPPFWTRCKSLVVRTPPSRRRIIIIIKRFI